MTFRSILSPISGTESDAAVLNAALHVARTFNGHIDALHIERELHDLPIRRAAGYEMARAYEAARLVEEETETRRSSAQTQFEDFLKASEIKMYDTPSPRQSPSASWSVERGLEPAVVTEQGLTHDLIVVSHPNAANGHDARETIEAALFGTGRPVLITPPKTFDKIGETVMIGWNRTIQSARAVAAAMPFLETARRVVVCMVTTGAKQGPSPQDLARTLAWNNINAEVKEVAPDKRKVGEILLAEAEAIDADLLVMGAYSHSRLREMILGGVTRHVLDHAEIPLLMTH